jgi:hypothetical protein
MKKPRPFSTYETPEWVNRLIGGLIAAVVVCLFWDGLIYVIGLLYFSESPDKAALGVTNAAIGLLIAGLIVSARNTKEGE